ncbi:MAG TPA: iron donor protein CyaY [Burkholderiaceae bacterium]|nr:iron donor protein CyaY [Burkholderiaceae bacterium]
MSDQAFQQAAEAVLDAIEAAVERAIDEADLDVEIERQGNVITLDFDDGSKVVVNSHSAAREIWVAARSGGFHYRPVDGRWIDGRNGEELWAALSRVVSQQGGAPVVLAPR